MSGGYKVLLLGASGVGKVYSLSSFRNSVLNIYLKDLTHENGFVGYLPGCL